MADPVPTSRLGVEEENTENCEIYSEISEDTHAEASSSALTFRGPQKYDESGPSPWSSDQDSEIDEDYDESDGNQSSPSIESQLEPQSRVEIQPTSSGAYNLETSVFNQSLEIPSESKDHSRAAESGGEEKVLAKILG